MNTVIFLFIISITQTVKPDKGFYMEIPAFKDAKYIPAQYTCDGRDISPEIQFHNIPDSAKSIVVISDDPDAPMGTWVHWVIYNIPPDSIHIPEKFPKKMKVGVICQGINDFGKYGYGGPCPPKGAHRYFFKVYVLDTVFVCNHKMTKKKLLKLMEGHIIAGDTVIKKYRRMKR